MRKEMLLFSNCKTSFHDLTVRLSLLEIIRPLLKAAFNLGLDNLG